MKLRGVIRRPALPQNPVNLARHVKLTEVHEHKVFVLEVRGAFEEFVEVNMTARARCLEAVSYTHLTLPTTPYV